ncbi:hypothetical protein R80B4_02596 [Fibrobacteres bacterium R8-0-B4]
MRRLLRLRRLRPEKGVAARRRKGHFRPAPGAYQRLALLLSRRHEALVVRHRLHEPPALRQRRPCRGPGAHYGLRLARQTLHPHYLRLRFERFPDVGVRPLGRREHQERGGDGRDRRAAAVVQGRAARHLRHLRPSGDQEGRHFAGQGLGGAGRLLALLVQRGGSGGLPRLQAQDGGGR